MFDDLTPSEAVLSFAAWLAHRSESAIVGWGRDARYLAELAAKFCLANGLEEPGEDFAGRVRNPDQVSLGPPDGLEVWQSDDRDPEAWRGGEAADV